MSTLFYVYKLIKHISIHNKIIYQHFNVLDKKNLSFYNR